MKTITYFLLCLALGAGMLTCTGGAPAGDRTGVSDTEIIIGTWGPLSGPAALWGNIIKGMDAATKYLNDQGGIHGRSIRLIYKDDAYDPSRTVPAVRELVLNDEIFAAVGGIGTATNMAVLPFLEEQQIPWFTPLSGASEWTFPGRPTIYSLFPLYFDEAEIMTRHAVEGGLSRIGVIYQNDDFGKSGLVSIQNTLSQLGLEAPAAMPVEVTDTDLGSHIARLKDAGAEAVMLWVLPRQAAIALGTAAVMAFRPQWYASLVLSDMPLMFDITQGAWQGVIFSYLGNLQPYETSNTRVNAFRSAFDAAYPGDRWGTFPMIGCALMDVVTTALQQAGPDLTREGFLEAMSNIRGHTTLTGVDLNFSVESHHGTRLVTLFRCQSATEAEMLGQMEGKADIVAMARQLHQ